MVFPKPGLQFRYRYKLPDSVQRRPMQTNHDYAKVYELLSDEDLHDIRGVGLAKLDEEEGALFDSEKAKNESKNAAAVAAKSGTAAESSKSVSRQKRASLMRELKGLKQAKEKEEMGNQEETQPPDNAEEDEKQIESPAKNDVQLEQSDMVKDVKKPVNRGKKRKMVEQRVLDQETITKAFANAAATIKDDSSKENESEWASGSELRFYLERVQQGSLTMTSSESMWKPRLSSNSTSKELKMGLPEKKQIINGESGSGRAQTIDRNDCNKRAKFSSLYDFTSSSDYDNSKWPQANLPKKKTRKAKHKAKVAKKSASLLDPFKISEHLQKSKQKKAKKSSSKKRARRSSKLFPQELTTTQILRKVRYTIEKYFAKMPGTGYRCPSMREPAHRCDQDDPNSVKVWLCLVCHKEELDEKGDVMICCDLCEDWYHLRCVGVPDEKYPENMKWYCKRCMAKSIRAGTFDPNKFPLYV